MQIYDLCLWGHWAADWVPPDGRTGECHQDRVMIPIAEMPLLLEMLVIQEMLAIP